MQISNKTQSTPQLDIKQHPKQKNAIGKKTNFKTLMIPDGMRPDLPSPKVLANRTKVAQEILSTETSYVNSLSSINSVFVEPLTKVSTCSKTMIITPDQIQAIFNNIQVLCTLNTYFLDNLNKRMLKWDPDSTKLSDLFLQFAPFFRMYSQYVTKFEEVPKILNQLLKTNMRFRKFCDQAKTNIYCNIGLESLLIMPIQRIPRYKLLLQELLKVTPTFHKDYEGLCEAHVLVSKVATQINEDLLIQQNHESIRRLESQFIDTILFFHPNRRLIRQGECIRKSCNGDRKYHFFLFNDLIGYATIVKKSNTKQYKFVRSIEIRMFHSVQHVIVKSDSTEDAREKQNGIQKKVPVVGKKSKSSSFDILSNTSVESSKISPSKINPFLSHRLMESSVKLDIPSTFVLIGLNETLVMCCESSRDSYGWVDDIKLCIEEVKQFHRIPEIQVYKRNDITSGEWHPNEIDNHCPLCGVVFTLFLRRHQCRKCDSLICAGCSTGKIIINGASTPQRVCDKCNPASTNTQSKSKSSKIGKEEIIGKRSEIKSHENRQEHDSKKDAKKKSLNYNKKKHDSKSAIGSKSYQNLIKFMNSPHWKKDDSQKNFDTNINIWKMDHCQSERKSQTTREKIKIITIIKTKPRRVFDLVYNHHLEMRHGSRLIKSFGRTKLLHVKFLSKRFWKSDVRDFVIVKDWRMTENGSYCVLSQSVKSPLVPPQSGTIRSCMIVDGWLMRPFSTKEGSFKWTELIYVSDFDLKNCVPNWLRLAIYTDRKSVV